MQTRASRPRKRALVANVAAADLARYGLVVAGCSPMG